jgi:hypothetical protein
VRANLDWLVKDKNAHYIAIAPGTAGRRDHTTPAETLRLHRLEYGGLLPNLTEMADATTCRSGTQ